MAEPGPAILLALLDHDLVEEIAIELEEAGFVVTTARGAEHAAADVVVGDGPPVDRTTPHVLIGAASEAANVLGNLPASASVETIAAAVRLAAAGYSFARTGDGHDNGGDDEAAPPSPVHLTARERQVLSLLADGAPNKVIARALDISVHTAKFHVAALLQKLGAKNRTDAIVIAIRDGYELY